MDWHSPRDWLRVIARSSKRIAVFLVGTVMVLAGVAMLVLPGPGLLVIIAGLAVLATEFAWAEFLLDKAKEQAAKTADQAKQRWRGRRRNGTAPEGDGFGAKAAAEIADIAAESDAGPTDEDPSREVSSN